jgi:HEAT repeat protein
MTYPDFGRRLIICLVLSAYIAGSGIAAETDAVLDRAVKEYLRGDYVSAIKDFDTVLDAKDDPKARRLLYKSLEEQAKLEYDREDYRSALEHYERAYEIDSGDKALKTRIEELTGKLGREQSLALRKQDELKQLKKKVALEASKKSSYYSRLKTVENEKNIVEDALENSKEEVQYLKSLITKNEQRSLKISRALLLTIPAVLLTGGLVVFFLIRSMKRLADISSESRYQLEDMRKELGQRLEDEEKDMEELETKVAKSINQMVEGQRQAVKQLGESAGANARSDIEEMRADLAEHYEREMQTLLNLLDQQARSLRNEFTEKVELPDGRVITDVNSQVRARADSVEMIPATVNDPKIAERMLRPYLSDPNNRVRANAAVAIHRYNPEASIDSLRKMTSSADKWMRLSAAWALGQISSPEAVPLLRKLIDDPEERIRRKAVEAFEGMAAVKQGIDQEIRKMIDEAKKKTDPERGRGA